MNWIELARKLRPLIEKAAQSLDDEDALDAVELYPAWDGNGAELIAGKRVRDEGILYSILQTHISQPNWKPKNAPSLFARVLIPDPYVVPEWIQPDSTNPYMKGDKVRYNGQFWQSNMDNNVWEPGVYGWDVIQGSE